MNTEHSQQFHLEKASNLDNFEHNNNNILELKFLHQKENENLVMDQNAESSNAFHMYKEEDSKWAKFEDEDDESSSSLFLNPGDKKDSKNETKNNQQYYEETSHASGPPSSEYKPAIPPRLSLGQSFSTVSTDVKSPSQDTDFAVFEDFNFSPLGNEESGLITTKIENATKPPPIPPRASEVRLFEMTLPTMDEHRTNAIENSKTNFCEQFSWAKFDKNSEKLNNNESSISKQPNDDSPELTIFSPSTIMKDDAKVKSESHTRRLSVKKPANGYFHLTNDDDETEASISSGLNTLDGSSHVQTIDHSLDCSPTKPLSKWTTFSNEEDESKEEVLKEDETEDMFLSVTNTIDIDNEDDFSLNANRLSVDMTDLKGFNRVDKGSQNNLVDFSAMKDGVDDADDSVEDIAAEDEQDTIFDLTAQGDSLKRRQPKESKGCSLSEEDAPVPSDAECHVGPAAFEEPSVLEELDKNSSIFPDTPTGTNSYVSHPAQSSTSSRTNSPAVSNDSSIPQGSNPFWTDTAALDLQSSFNNSPFDAVIFSSQKSQQPTSPVQSMTNSSCTSPAKTSPLVRLPPPPVSSSRSSQRSRCRSTSSDKSIVGKSAVKKLQLDFDEEFNLFDDALKPDPQPLMIINDALTENDKTDENLVKSNENMEQFIFQDLFGINNPTTILPKESVEVTTLPAADSNLYPESIAENSQIKSEPDLFANFNDSFTGTNVDDNKNETKTVTDLFFESHIDITQSQNEQSDVATSSEENDIDKLIALTKSTSVESPNSTLVEPSKPMIPGVELMPKQNGWAAYMRFPREKRTMSTRKWVEIYVRLNVAKIDNPMIHLLYTEKTKTPFHTISLASHHMQYTEPNLQAMFSDDGQIQRKLHAVKVMVVYYREKRAFSPKRSQFAMRNTSGFKHTSNSKQSVKLGFEKYANVCNFVEAMQNAMMECHKRTVKSDEDHSPVVKYHSRDEILINCCDKLQAVVSDNGLLEKCSLNVHMFITSFLSGDPLVRITINDKKLEGKEVVCREDIIPTSMDRWIDVADPVLHKCCTADSYGVDVDTWGMCTFYPPDARKAELMRFTTSYEDKELPVIVRSNIEIKGARLQLRSILRMSQAHNADGDVLNQIPCEDLMIRFPVPIQWSNFFRIDGRFRNHNVHAKRSARQKRPGGVTREAGISMETSVGNAKYERAYDAIVWRMAQFPEKNAAENTPHVFTCTIELPSDCEFKHLHTSDEVVVDEKYRWSEVEYTMPSATASHVCVRSVSLPNSDRAEKFVCYSSHYLYKVKMVVQSSRVSEEGMEDKAFSLCNVQ